MNMYRKNLISNNSYNNDACLLLKQTLLNFEKHSALYLFSNESFDNKVKLDWPPPIQEDDRGINILGSGINGILCLYVNGLSSKLVVWNPAIQEFKVIPPNPAVFVPSYVRFASQHHGFGYDCIRSDYKVIRYVEFFTSLCYFLDARMNMSASKVLHDPIWEIYSLKSNSWKKLDLDMKKIYRSPVSVVEQVYMNGVCHWLGKSERDIDNFYLVSFDLGNEGFFLTSIPSIMYNIIDFELVNTHLLLLNESIALIYKDIETATFHISILGEIGVRESWTKLFIIGPFPGLGNPIGVGKNGDIFFTKDEELARCDLTTNTVQELGIKSMFFCCQMVIYKENLLSIEE
jgi:molecular chaperone HtpG